MIKLNLGCWKRNFPGFINIDILDYPHVHFRTSVEDLSMFEDESVDLVYASHVLEYFTLEDVPRVLQEWRRVLKPGGILKIAVPDFEALVSVYEKYKNPLMIQGSIFAIVDKVLETKEGKPIFHNMIYDERLLKKILEDSLFTNIKRYDWKEFLPKGAVDRSAAHIPREDYTNGTLVSLNVQAVKG